MAALLCLLLLGLPLAGCGQGGAGLSVKIALPYNEYIRNIGQNYYKQWLEERSGLAIEFVFIHEAEQEDYLRALFASGYSDIDAIFFPAAGQEGAVDASAVEEFGRLGYIRPLDGYLEAGGENIRALFGAFSDYDLRAKMTASDGRLYYMPNLNTSRLNQCRQVLWVNTEWLAALEQPQPQTTAELTELLASFAGGDANRNGRRDEVPVAGSPDGKATQLHNFLLNSFVYNDPDNARLFVQEGAVRYAPLTGEWRQGVQYVAGLYASGLLPALNYSFTTQQLGALVNDPRDLVGAFTSGSITEVVYPGSAEILSKYIHVLPPEGPAGQRYVVANTPLPSPGGIITAACQSPQAVFDLMDLMVSEEASLIASYGEPGVDWDYARPGDISISGETARINVLTRLDGRLQNKHIDSVGPMVVRSEYADYVTWSGLEADNEYIDARSAAAYRHWMPEEHLPTLQFPPGDAQRLEALRAGLDGYTDDWLRRFITGEADPGDDAQWQRYQQGYEGLGLGEFLAAAQQSYSNTLAWREGHS